jgi:hypothetical protein
MAQSEPVSLALLHKSSHSAESKKNVQQFDLNGFFTRTGRAVDG